MQLDQEISKCLVKVLQVLKSLLQSIWKPGRSSNECIDDALACELVDDDVIIPLETANPMNNSICVEETKSEPIKKYVHHIISILTES